MDELEISGRRYISTRRAGKDHKYHADYIGQLIRAKKVEGKKVGRAWYVDAESLAEYLGQPTQTDKKFPAPHNQVSLKVTMPVVADEEEKELETSENATADATPKQEVSESNIITEENIATIPIYKTTREALEAKKNVRYVAEEGPLIPQVKKINQKTYEEHTVAMRYREPQPIPVRLESVQEIRMEKVVPNEYTTTQPIVTFEKPVSATKKRSTAPLALRVGVVAILGLVVFILAGLISDHIFFTLIVNGKESASVGYSIE